MARAVAAFANSVGCKPKDPKEYQEVAPLMFFPNMNKPAKDSMETKKINPEKFS